MKDEMRESPTFWEDLPEMCPPIEAGHIEGKSFARLIPAEEATLQYFQSHKKLRTPINPKSLELVGECRYASCSLFELPLAYQHKDLAKLPAIKCMRYVCILSLTKDSGVALRKKKSGKKHIDMWFYSDFDILGSVINITEMS